MSDPLSHRTARAFVRTPYQGEIRLEYGRDQQLDSRTVDISAGGVFVAARHPQPVGTLVRFSMPVLGGTRKVTGYGEVTWIRVRDDAKVGPAGMGVQFRYLDEPGETWLREHEMQVQAQAVLAPPSPVPPGERPLPLVQPGAPVRPSPPLADPALWPPDKPAAPTVAVPWASEPRYSPRGGEEPLPEPPELEAGDYVAAPERRLGRPLVLAAVGLLLVAGVLLGRGPLLRWLDREPAVADPAPAATAGRADDPEAARAGDGGSVPELPAAAPSTAAPAPTAVARPTNAPPPAAPAPGGPLTRVASITFGSVPGETIVVITGDGEILEPRVSRQRLGGAEPRELLRIAGIAAPYEPALIPVGTRELLRIRTGHHPGVGGGELYVVFDLPGPRSEVRLDFQPTGLRVYLRRG